MAKMDETIAELFKHTEEQCLQMFAESICEADKCGEQKWGVTLRQGDRVRLNVGGVVVCTLHRGRIWFVLDKKHYGSADYVFLDDSEDWKWTPRYDYKVLPSMNGYYVPSSPRKHTETYRHIQKMHFSFIGKVADKYARLRKPCQESHSPEFLEYLRTRLTQPSLPNPVY